MREFSTLSPELQARVAVGVRRLFALEPNNANSAKAEPDVGSES
jgi:hypothetical protein